jgi:hypothetical protein
VCKTWSLTFREEHRLRVFGHRELRKIFVLKRDEVTRDWRRLHKEELYDLYSSSNIIWVVKQRRRWAGNFARMIKRKVLVLGGWGWGNSRKYTTCKT